jgi:hypothetical protein
MKSLFAALVIQAVVAAAECAHAADADEGPLTEDTVWAFVKKNRLDCKTSAPRSSDRHGAMSG